MRTIETTRRGVVVACTVGNMVGLTAAIHATFGLFLIPLSAAFGWPRAAISGVLGLIALMAAATYPLAGRYADRHGVRRMVLAGNLLLAAGIAGLASSDGSLVRFYLNFAVLGVAGAVASTAILAKAVSDWCEARRGTMLGIAAGLGNGLGATLMPVAAAAMLPVFGWRGAYVGVALIVAGLGFPVMATLLRDAPRYGGATAETAAPAADGLTLAEAARTASFWLLLISVASAAGCLTAIFSHVVPILAERGIATGAATAVLSVFALVTAGWQIATGTLLDRVPSPRMVAPMVIAAVCGLALVATGTGAAPLLAGGALLGVGLGAQYGALPFLIARAFGLRAFGSIIGAMYAAVALAQGATPVLLDHAFDSQGTYGHALVAIGLCLVASAALLLVAPGRRHDANVAMPA